MKRSAYNKVRDIFETGEQNLSKSSVAARAGVSPESLRKILDVMLSSGYILKQKNGNYYHPIVKTPEEIAAILLEKQFQPSLTSAELSKATLEDIETRVIDILTIWTERYLTVQEISTLADYSVEQLNPVIERLISKNTIRRVKSKEYPNGIYHLAAAKESISVSDALRKVEETPRITVAEALKKKYNFVRIKVGPGNNGEGDYSLIFLLGSSVIKEREWKKGDRLELEWNPAQREFTIFKSDVGRVLTEGDARHCLVYPIPNGFGFPKPIMEGEQLINPESISGSARELKIYLNGLEVKYT